MLGFLSFLAFAAAIVCAVALAMTVVRSVRKQPRRPFAILAVASCVAFLALSVAVSSIYTPQEEPVSSAASASAGASESVAEPEESSSASVEPSASASAPVDEPEQSAAVPVADESEPEPAPEPEPEPIVEQPAASSESAEEQPAPEPADESSESEPDTALIRSYFDAIISENDGAIVSIEPRTIDGEVYSWAIVDVTVPDAWYAVVESTREKYCENVGTYVKAAVIAGGAAENEAGVSVHFYDTAGEEVAESKMFSGYKLK